MVSVASLVANRCHPARDRFEGLSEGGVHAAQPVVFSCSGDLLTKLLAAIPHVLERYLQGRAGVGDGDSAAPLLELAQRLLQLWVHVAQGWVMDEECRHSPVDEHSGAVLVSSHDLPAADCESTAPQRLVDFSEERLLSLP
jgi:hypothetical protein